MKCLNCGADCWQDKVDIGCAGGSGWRCADCGWYEGFEIDAAIDADRDDERTSDAS